MNKYVLEVSQNGWEYTGFVFIDCNHLYKDLEDSRVVHADGVRIKFDEEVGKIVKK